MITPSNFHRIDRVVRVVLLSAVVLLVGVICFMFEGSPGADRLAADKIGPLVAVHRKPLVIVNGAQQQIPDADILATPGGQATSFVGINLNVDATNPLMVDSTAACTGNVPNSACLPFFITQYVFAAPSITMRRALGTQAAPTPLTAAGQCMAQMREAMYTTTGFQGLPQVYEAACNAEPGSPTATAQGTYWEARSVGIGTTNAAQGIKLDSTGNVGIGHSFDDETVPFGITNLGSYGNSAIIQAAALNNTTVNDWVITDTLSPMTLANSFYVREACTGAVTITGIAGGGGATSKNGVPFGVLGGREFVFDNIGAGTCHFTNEDAGSTAVDRILTPAAVTVDVGPQCEVWFWWDNISTRWKIKSKTC